MAVSSPTDWYTRSQHDPVYDKIFTRRNNIRGQNENHDPENREPCRSRSASRNARKRHLNEGDSVEIEVQGGQIVIKPSRVKPKYTLSELVAQCDENAPYPDELRNWDEALAVGQEAL